MKPLTELLEELKAKGEALGDATAHEQQLEDERPLLKEMAIVRIMERDKCAATPAEKIVKSDLEYMNHRIAQRASVVARFRAEAEYEAAKAAATQASLITPAMIELEARVAEWQVAINNANSAVTEATEVNAALVQEVEARNVEIKRLTGVNQSVKRETDLKHIALRRANGYLADRIRDVDELTRINRDLSAQLEVAPRKVPATLDSLEQSRESLGAEVGS